jgi:molybdate transport system substrate-binding protein
MRKLSAFALGALIATTISANATELKLFSANGAKLIVVDLVSQFERTTNNKVSITYGEAGDLRKSIQDGEAFDVVIVPAIELLAPSGKLASDSVAKIAHSDFGMGMRSDVPKPDTSTADGLKRLLLGVKAIAYTDPKTGGASGVLFVRVLDKLGIADQVNKKSKLVAGIHNAELVAKGEAELAVQLSHEILAVPGIQFLPMPPEFQSSVVFSAGVSANANEPNAARALVQLLMSSTAVPVIKANGMQPG